MLYKLNGTALACNSDSFDDANSTAAVFPSFVLVREPPAGAYTGCW
ncbi:hypothetical protein PC116_g11645 [Phytophthora cactorum]|uniref:Uncharacterized protein n=1 Tax=Phytophthora cactorum TaxID=29920 RepID=A0A8T1KZ75_9STRA|nr:hypothetical protein PC117_g8822 [Phytophthora cactorum]KAG3022790.1 hypothetical protein PC120_g7928 [Phytophthora cactorum]KAG3024048.1 hypothetical protein PC119_g8670 [Phytophthora cactorum]KAG3175142.1 hypothetical protein C6341_g9600 [Phytophthora cactorum]KAG4056852.1 hypothetical protein PC123_g8112 [Phytophthora cactorum]